MISKTFSGTINRNRARQMLHEMPKTSYFVPRKVDKPLILYGAGNLGKMAKQYFDRLGIPVKCVIDKEYQRARKDPFWIGTEIFNERQFGPPGTLREEAMLVICVATSQLSEITAPLREQGWVDIVPFYDITEAYKDRLPINNGWHIGCLRPHVKDIEPVLFRWEDDISRAHYLQFIAWHAQREEWIFDSAPVVTDRYFIPEVLAVLHDHEVFVDVGAHHGEVIQRYIKEVKKYERICAFEPDGENFKTLYNNLKDIIDEKIYLSTKALGAEEEERWFAEGLGYASQFSLSGHNKVDVKRLDDFNIPATFIKIHVEGWESEVISGGLETIRKERPILAVTSYHNRDGLWHLPAQLMTMLDNYAFYFRLHAWQGQGSVIYAIPRERQNAGCQCMHTADEIICKSKMG